MAATLTLHHSAELSGVGAGEVPVFPDAAPPETIQDLVERYNYAYEQQGVKGVFGDLADRERDQNGMSYSVYGGPAEVLVLLPNPFGTGLQARAKRFRAKILYDCLVAEGVVGPDGRTPQIVQIGAGSHDTNIPLSRSEHRLVSGGDVSPITNKMAELVFRNFPEAQSVISIGYSLPGFLNPDLLMSLSKHKDVLAGLIANPPGVVPEPKAAILGKFAKAAGNMDHHLLKGGIRVLEPGVLPQGLLHVKGSSIADVLWRPVNLSLWRAFSHGRLLQRIDEARRVLPATDIRVAWGNEDALCSPGHLADYVRRTGLVGTVIENGDHAWGYNFPRSMGSLITRQLAEVLSADSPRHHPAPALGLAA